MTEEVSQERERRWRLAVGGEDDALPAGDQRLSAALSALYRGPEDEDGKKGKSKRQKGGLGRSAPQVARWMGDIREFFPSPVVQIIQKDA
ncbi:MAG: hypothetical protein ABJF79_01410, partial [Paracoccaceae bacterium]